MPSRRDPWRPTRAELAASHGKRVPDIIGRDLRVLFVGINPGLYSGATGHHLAHPGNRFWKALHASGFTREAISPFDERTLLEDGLGITNIVLHATTSAAELSPDELRRGGRTLERKVRRYRPRVVTFLGLDAYRTSFERPRARVGRQPETVGGARLWVLPNPSGLNASYQLPALTRLFRALRRSIDAEQA